MITKEYRIVLPFSIAEYELGQLYTIMHASKTESDRVEILKNEPFSNTPLLNGAYDRGQYTKKIFHLQSKASMVPSFIRTIVPNRALNIHEEAWNAYPYCKTLITNPDYMKDNFYVKVDTIYLPDRGTTENAHNLSPEELKKRSVVVIDIADDKIANVKANDANKDTPPSQFKSAKTGRGPLSKDWRDTVEPVICAYKLVTVHFQWVGAGSMVESYTHKQYPRVFSKFHREAFCKMDSWVGLTMAEIRDMEEKAKIESSRSPCGSREKTI